MHTRHLLASARLAGHPLPMQTRMWCTSCQQDVAGVQTPDTGQFVCPRCKGGLWDPMRPIPPSARLPDPEEPATAKPSSQPAEFTGPREPASLDTWELDEQLRHAARLLGLDPGDDARVPARIDPAQPTALGWHRRRGRAAAGKLPRLRRKLRIGEAFSAVATWVGAATLTCGICLLGWSEVSSRPELQAIGLVIAIGGILMLVIGMTLRLGQTDSRAQAPTAQRRFDPHSKLPRRHTPVGRSARRRSGKANRPVASPGLSQL